MISTAQKAIIRQICREQEESLLRLMEFECEKLYNEFIEEGYEVSMSEIAEEIAKQLIFWDRVKKSPEKLTQVLDEANLGLIKHHLVQSYLKHPHTSEIWKHLNLYDKVNSNPN